MIYKNAFCFNFIGLKKYLYCETIPFSVKIAESEQIPAYEFALEALSLAQELLLVSASPYIEHKIYI